MMHYQKNLFTLDGKGPMPRVHSRTKRLMQARMLEAALVRERTLRNVFPSCIGKMEQRSPFPLTGEG
jgi:hypothetical protein